MNINKKQLKSSVADLCVILAPYFEIKNEGKSVSVDGTEEMSVELWNADFGGVRIAEIGVLYRNGHGGSTILRCDVLNGGYGAEYNARLFLACENWLVGDLFRRQKDKELRKEGRMLCTEGEEQIDAVFKAMERATKRAEERAEKRKKKD